MLTPYKPERPNGGAQTPTEQRFVGAVEAVEHCLCGIVGLVLTGVILGLSYSTLVAVTEPLYVLSSTALVAIASSVWLLTWLGVEFVWEYRSGRLVTET